jgi:rubrerythrin
MTVQSDLQKAVAQCQSLLGTYEVSATSTQDQAAKKMFQELAQDMQRHIDHLNNRLSYLEKNNPMYQQQQQAQQ